MKRLRIIELAPTGRSFHGLGFIGLVILAAFMFVGCSTAPKTGPTECSGDNWFSSDGLTYNNYTRNIRVTLPDANWSGWSSRQEVPGQYRQDWLCPKGKNGSQIFWGRNARNEQNLLVYSVPFDRSIKMKHLSAEELIEHIESRMNETLSNFLKQVKGKFKVARRVNRNFAYSDLEIQARNGQVFKGAMVMIAEEGEFIFLCVLCDSRHYASHNEALWGIIDSYASIN